MRLCFAILCGLLLCASDAASSSAASLRDFIDFSDPSLPGRLYVPPQAATGPRPLIVFLHGAGESGTDNTAQVNGNIDNLLTAAKARGAYLYAPQTAIGWNSSTAIDRVMAMVDRASAEQNVDELRFYATGLSMGGGGTWNLINRHGARFAAAAPICAVLPATGYSAANLAQVPTWAFHAKDDATVSYTTTRSVVASILGTTGETLPAYPVRPTADFAFQSSTLDLRHTEYRTGGHGIWGRVYNTPAFYDWMFAHALVPEPSGLAIMFVTGLGLLGTCRRSITRRRST
ncbi:MAG: PEP-CTERM sorting domain-containing protein [Planctomycetaceae bacterium]|jgi:predicted peptidase|nr:PEP-CTERM sorting domain-containing protein [Planctomycetaceae bacterium]